MEFERSSNAPYSKAISDDMVYVGLVSKEEKRGEGRRERGNGREGDEGREGAHSGTSQRGITAGHHSGTSQRGITAGHHSGA